MAVRLVRTTERRTSFATRTHSHPLGHSRGPAMPLRRANPDRPQSSRSRRVRQTRQEIARCPTRRIGSRDRSTSMFGYGVSHERERGRRDPGHGPGAPISLRARVRLRDDLSTAHGARERSGARRWPPHGDKSCHSPSAAFVDGHNLWQTAIRDAIHSPRRKNPSEWRWLAEQIDPRCALFRQSNNPTARIESMRIARGYIEEIASAARGQSLFFVTLAPAKFSIPLSEAAKFDPKRMMGWIAQAIPGAQLRRHDRDGLL